MEKRGVKGQIALEYLLLTGVAFLVVFAFFYYVTEETNSNMKLNKAHDAVNMLARTADMVYALGPGSQDYIKIDMPGSIESASIANNEISMKIKIFRGVSDVFAKTKANVTGTLPIGGGIVHVSVKALENSSVMISSS